MRCEPARRLLSADLDGEADDSAVAGVAAHLAACADCRAFAADAAELRRRLRFEVVDAVPDVTPSVLRAVGAQPPPARLRRPRERVRAPASLAPIAAAFLAGVIAATTFLGLGSRPPAQVAAAPLRERVLAGQGAVSTLSADVTVTEHGWHSEVGVRRYTGRLRYRAPESFSFRLRDRTRYPRGAWVPHHLTSVVDDDVAWRRGAAGCPREVQPHCATRGKQVEAVVDREPFSEDTLSPLDVVVPVRSLLLAAEPPQLRKGTVDGHRALGLPVTVAQVRPLLDGILQGRGWRELHPSDPVDLWLTEQMVPLALTVRAGGGRERSWWAARAGYDEPAGTVLLTVELSEVVVNGNLPDGAFPPPPASVRPRGGGFTDGEAPAAPVPGWLPPGMRPHRTGTLATGSGNVSVATFSDGRAWLKVRATTHGAADGLFSDLGSLVRRVRLPGAGVAYVAEGGERIGLHAAGLDLQVSGSVGEPALRQVAASLGTHGRPVPSGWLSGGAATLVDALRADPDLLVPESPEGFAPPAVEVTGRATTLTYVGAGARGFQVAQLPGALLTPPLERDVRAVRVRGTSGRYTPALGELEWIESGRVVSLRSRTLPLAELLALAEFLRSR